MEGNKVEPLRIQWLPQLHEWGIMWHQRVVRTYKIHQDAVRLLAQIREQIGEPEQDKR